MKKITDKMSKLFEKYKIAFFILASSFILFAPSLPYVNLVLTKELVIFLISVSFFVIFKISWRKILYIIFLLFFMVFILTILKEGKTASLFGDYIYGFLVVALISFYR